MEDFGDFYEYGTYEYEDDLYLLNQREADDYRNEGGDEDEGFDPEPEVAEDFDIEDGPEFD